ncbi:hypothetical protein TRAPUB_4377 [Trametes pubescens]|uniref:Uncharacterized protein n=1 Tax=Trametes pubescens TaxID=154538 RepID=A0A1M2W7B4_TRAPU|nr:hypothetical protein TRAPUB_4377 [Trametes pubescens]
MRESGEFDERVVEAIRRIRAAGKWRVIALTNNFSKSDADIIGDGPPSPTAHAPQPAFDVQAELAFLGWQDGATPPRLRALFDDFCDSSTLGMRCACSRPPHIALLADHARPPPSSRKPEPGIYLLACARSGIAPSEAVFLDDLGM